MQGLLVFPMVSRIQMYQGAEPQSPAFCRMEMEVNVNLPTLSEINDFTALDHRLHQVGAEAVAQMAII